MPGVNCTDIPSMHSYQCALIHWNKVKPGRGEDESAWRPLGSRRCRNKVLRKLADGSIACRLYRTDIVVWHPDGNFTVTGYRSMSTGVLVNLLIPANVYYNAVKGEMHIGRGNCWYKDTRIVKLDGGDSITFTQAGDPVDEDALHDWEVIRPDRKVTRKLCAEYRLGDMTHYLRAIMGLKHIDQIQVDLETHVEAPERALNLMREGEFAEALACLPTVVPKPFGGGNRWHSRSDRVITLSSVGVCRRLLYQRHPEALVTTRHKYLTSAELRTARLNERLYG